jgi:adenosylcobinamide-phosphate synthase
MHWAEGAVLVAALVVDRCVGEWPGALHPVVWMGRMVRACERRAPQRGRAVPFVLGLGMALALPAAWAAAGWLAVRLPWVGPLCAVYLLKSSFALRLLGEAGEGVARPLAAGDLDEGRRRLSWLCSRDAGALDASLVSAGAVESLAENLSDSFVAPLFWFLVAGVPGALAYRMVNTLDAMVGYRGRYEWLGKASARLDDLLNLVPARLTALALVLVAPWTGGDARRGLRTGWRHRGRTESPNAGWPMATMAGLLGVRLVKRAHYSLGEGRDPVPGDIARAWRMCAAAGALVAVGTVLASLG